MAHHNQSNYVLTDDDVLNIFEWAKIKGWSNSKIAKKIGCSPTAVSDVLTERCHTDVLTIYRHLERPVNYAMQKASNDQIEWIKSLPEDWSAPKIRKAMISKYGRKKALSERRIREIRSH